MWIPRPPNGPDRPGPGPGWSLGPSGSHPRLGFLYHFCTIISSCFYVFCCCWLLEDCFGGPRRRHYHIGPPFESPDYQGPNFGPEPPLGHFGPRSHPGPIEFPGEPQLGHFGPSNQPGPVGFPGEPPY